MEQLFDNLCAYPKAVTSEQAQLQFGLFSEQVR